MSSQGASAALEYLLDQPKLKIVDDVDSSSSGSGLSEQQVDQSQNEYFSSKFDGEDSDNVEGNQELSHSIGQSSQSHEC